MGIAPRNLEKADPGWGTATGSTVAVPWIVRLDTVAGTTAYTFIAKAQARFEVVRAWGIMLGAGGAGDLVVISTTTGAFTDTVDLSVFSDTDQFDFCQIDDSANVVQKGQALTATTASDPLMRLYVECVWT